MTTVKSSGQSIDVSETFTGDTAYNSAKINVDDGPIASLSSFGTQSTDTDELAAEFANQLSSAVARQVENTVAWGADVANSTAEGTAADVKNTIQDAEAKLLASNPFLAKIK